MNKELSERKKLIIHALVDLYIKTGQPVSSSDIQNIYLPDVSSATIRSELSALEALGYIEQPHTSAGRIPLKDAYKFYVETINSNSSNPSSLLSDQETEFIRNYFVKNLSKVEDLSKEAAKIISDVTNYTSFFVEKNNNLVVIEEVKLVPLMSNKAVVLIVTNKGMVSDKAIDIKPGVKTEYIDTASQLLNKIFQGKSISDVEKFDIKEIEDEIAGFKEIFDDVLSILKVYINEHSENVHVEGALKMLDYPEYNNVEDAKHFLSVINDKNSVSEFIIDDVDSNIEFQVKIGKEDSGVDKCAIVTAQYKVGEDIVGQAGVIGPERMDYKKVISVLDFMKKTFNNIIDNKFNDED